MTKKSTLRPIMFVGTGSDVGKSVLTAGFCRIFLQDGYHPAPFKAQNMSLNSYATPNGLEIGRAQAMQAEACGIPCSSDMNPVLLKPNSYMSSQVVLNGKAIGNQTAKEYFLKTDRESLFGEATKAYRRLEKHYNPIVLEGAGSISEVNLWDKDITNMKMALETNSAVMLVADIDKGGVFGSVYGTIQLLPPAEKALIKGIIINKFRGDISLFDKGKDILEELTGIPVVGIIPWFKDIYIDDEDSVVIDSKQQQSSNDKINIAVVLLKHISNFTDFNYLERLPQTHLFYTNNPEELANAHIIIIPGSKNTISDMMNLRTTGMASAIMAQHQAGKAVYGICGGYQIMGEMIFDPNHVEGDIEQIPGLGLLPIITTMTGAKTTEQAEFQFLNHQAICKGYEIHVGESVPKTPSPLCKLSNGKDDGYFVNSKTWGSYLHGIFDNELIINYILEQNGIATSEILEDNASFKDTQYNKLADHVRRNANLDYIYKILKNNE